MVELGLKIIVLLSQILLTAAYAGAWVIFSRGLQWGAASPMQTHLAISGMAVMFYLFGCLCVIFYFVGTGVWIRDRARELYPHNKESAEIIWAQYQAANKLKGRAFPFPTFGMVLGLFAAVLGGAAQVGAVPGWVHRTLATLTVVLAWAGTKMVFGAIKRNVELLDIASGELDKQG